MIKIRVKEVFSETVPHIIEEISHEFSKKTGMYSKIMAISDCYNWAVGDAIEAVASHIYHTDTDFIMDEDWRDKQ